MHFGLLLFQLRPEPSNLCARGVELLHLLGAFLARLLRWFDVTLREAHQPLAVPAFVTDAGLNLILQCPQSLLGRDVLKAESRTKLHGGDRAGERATLVLAGIAECAGGRRES